MKYERLQDELLALTDPAAHGLAVHGVRDAQDGRRHRDPHPRRGREARPDRPARLPAAFDVPGAPQVNRKQSGRLELAALADQRRNPLTPRVIVNRVWHHLFGQGS